MLFTVVGPNSRFKSKPIIDVVLYRGGDVISAWTITGLTQGLNFGLASMAGIGAVIAVIWTGVGLILGKNFISYCYNLTMYPLNQFDIYHKKIEEFKKMHPEFIYELGLEKFVESPEEESKKLMKFCDLPWNIKCLEFYKRKDLISKTQSNVQIRKTIYKDSMNKYLPYKQFLSKHGNKYSWFN